MAKITAGVGSSHVPLLGVAVDQGKEKDDYFGRSSVVTTGRANGKRLKSLTSCCWSIMTMPAIST